MTDTLQSVIDEMREAAMEYAPTACIDVNIFLDRLQALSASGREAVGYVRQGRAVVFYSDTTDHDIPPGTKLFLHPPATDEMAERLAQFIYRKESLNCKTLDEAIFHIGNWRRAIPEAREMLAAALTEVRTVTQEGL